MDAPADADGHQEIVAADDDVSIDDGSGGLLAEVVGTSSMNLQDIADGPELAMAVADLFRRDRTGAVRLMHALVQHCSLEELAPIKLRETAARQEDVEAKRLQKVEEMEARRRQKDEEKAVKRQAKQDEQRQQQEEKKRKREEEASRRAASSGVAQAPSKRLQQIEQGAAKKGFPVGASVEGPLLNGGPRSEYEGGWYAGTIVGFMNKRTSLVKFDAVDDLPAGATGDLERVMMPIESLRPAPPTELQNFDALVSLGAQLELSFEGGWWEVELLGVRGGAWVDPTPFDPARELGPGSRVRVRKADHEQGQEGLVSALAPGWLKVALSGGRMRNYRASELELSGGFAADGGGDGAAASAQATEATYTVRLLTAAAEAEGVYEVGRERLRPGWLWRAGKWAGRWTPHRRVQMEAAKEAAFASLQAEWPAGRRVEVMQRDEGFQGAWFAGVVLDHEAAEKSSAEHKCVVQYDELREFDDSDDEAVAAAVEWQSGARALPLFVNPELPTHMRPCPEPASPEEGEAWVAALAPGDAADLNFDGGWWDVEMIRLLSASQSKAALVAKRAAAKPAAAPAAAEGTEGGGEEEGEAGEAEGAVQMYLVKSMQYEAEHTVAAMA